MREILFRGKRKDNEEWIVGYYSYANDGHSIELYMIGEKATGVHYPVIPETIGQYTGLTDKNGKKIFEGDIVKSCEYDDVYFVKYFDNENYPAFDCVPDAPLCECNGLSFLANTEGCEIIGNIHDNPELLKGGAER